MNLMEGLRRIGIVIALVLALFTSLIYLLDRAPTGDRLANQTADAIVDIVWDAQDAAVRAGSYRWKMQEELWPGMDSHGIISKMCAKPPIDRIRFECDEYKRTGWQLTQLWAVHISTGIGIGVAVALGWGIVWAAFLWIVAGFIKPR